MCWLQGVNLNNSLAHSPNASHNDYAGFNSPVEIGLSDNQGGHTAKRGFFSSVTLCLVLVGHGVGAFMRASSLILVDQPRYVLPPLIGLNGVGFIPTNQERTHHA